MALTSLVKVKALLGISVSTFDTQLNALIAAADAAIKTEVDRALEYATYTEYYSGNGTRYLCLRETPVVSVTSVHLDFSGYYGDNPNGAFPASTLLTAGRDYVLRKDKGDGYSYSGILERIGTVWSELNRSYTQGKVTQEVAPAQGNIKIIYIAGYQSIPEDLQWCVAQIVQRMRLLARYGMFLTKEKLRDYSYELLPLAKQAMHELGGVERVLRMYKKVPF